MIQKPEINKLENKIKS